MKLTAKSRWAGTKIDELAGKTTSWLQGLIKGLRLNRPCHLLPLSCTISQ